NPALYDKIAGLDVELHALGPTLMRLDAIAAYQSDNADGLYLPENEPVVTDARRVYNIVTNVSSAGHALVGYFKDRVTRDDYILVVNKDTAPTATQAFTVYLGAAAG